MKAWTWVAVLCVASAGALGALTYHGISKFHRSVRSVEAVYEAGQIGRAAALAYEQNKQFCASSTYTVPALPFPPARIGLPADDDVPSVDALPQAAATDALAALDDHALGPIMAQVLEEDAPTTRFSRGGRWRWKPAVEAPARRSATISRCITDGRASSRTRGLRRRGRRPRFRGAFHLLGAIGFDGDLDYSDACRGSRGTT